MDLRLLGILVLAAVWLKLWRTPVRPDLDVGLDDEPPDDGGWERFRQLGGAPRLRRDRRDRVWCLLGRDAGALAL